MPLTIADINFHSLTRAEAAQLESELDATYPDLGRTPVQSNAFDGFFENHKYVVLGAVAVVAWSYFSHQRMNVIINRRMSTLL